jgi:hypothetical protein
VRFITDYSHVVLVRSRNLSEALGCCIGAEQNRLKTGHCSDFQTLAQFLLDQGPTSLVSRVAMTIIITRRIDS